MSSQPTATGLLHDREAAPRRRRPRAEGRRGAALNRAAGLLCSPGRWFGAELPSAVRAVQVYVGGSFVPNMAAMAVSRQTWTRLTFDHL